MAEKKAAKRVVDKIKNMEHYGTSRNIPQYPETTKI